EALGLATGQRRGGLAEAQVAEPHLLEVPQRAPEARVAVQALDRLIDRPLEHLIDRLTLELHVADLALEPLAVAPLARHEHVGEEDHLYEDVPGALARLAPPAPDVEGEGARRVPAGARE